MGALIGAVVGQIVNALRNPSSAGNTTETLSVWIGDLSAAIAELTRGVLRVFGREHDAWVIAEADAHQVGHDFEQIEGTIEQMFTRLMDVIIPSTLRNVVGYIVVHLIDPIRHRLDVDEAQISQLDRWQVKIDQWRNDKVDPDLTKLLAFVKWFDTWPLNVVTTWHDWFQKPGQFGDWAAPPLIGPLIGYLAATDHQQSRDNLLQLLIDASPDRWRHIEAATLAILNQEYP